MKHSLRQLRGRKTKDYPILDRWLREAATILQGIRYYASDYRPFQELEVPGVSLLLGAAASAGYYPISEYVTRKRNLNDRRQIDIGRGDLWFVAGTESYAFEFKRAWDRSSLNQLRSCVELAMQDAERIEDDEANHYFGAVLAPIFHTDDIHNYMNFAEVDYVGTIGDADPEVFIFLSKVIE